MTGSSQGAFAQMAYDESTFDVNSLPAAFISETLTAKYPLIKSPGIRGTRSQPKERNRRGLIDVSGSIVHEPSPTEWDFLLPYMLGTAESTDSFDMAETLIAFNVMIDRVAKVFTYTGCYVDQWEIRGSEGTPIQLELQILGTSESEGNAGTFPVLTFDTDAMYVFSDAVFTYASTPYVIDSFSLKGNNFLDRKWRNSTTANSIRPADRVITLEVTTPYTSSETALWTTSTSSAAADITITNGGQSMILNMPALVNDPLTTPNVPGKTEIQHSHTWQLFKTGSTLEFDITHDSVA